MKKGTLILVALVAVLAIWWWWARDAAGKSPIAKRNADLSGRLKDAARPLGDIMKVH